MRLYILVFICLSSISMACADIKEDKNTAITLSNEVTNGMDSLIYSNPKNYTFTLEKTEGATNIEVSSYKDMLDLFEKHQYTPESWQAGIREIPRIYLPIIGDKWGQTTSKEITTDNKKRMFFRGLAPMILRANELIMIDRNHLKNIRLSFNENKMSDDDNKWILKLAKLYKVELNENGITTSTLDELWEKVDIVPLSLALAQAAEESGWGTSKFADKGNALYGQWTWGENAITPEKQRKELGNYGIATFETLQQSISAYMLNLNTHKAYTSLRSKRAELRTKDQKITGHILAGQLTKYSERGEEYVKGLRSLMDYNLLSPADDAYLSDDPPIYLIPVAN
ncbi:glucosaminidase domain-containing protein [Algoriphagus sp. SE2]|uniref:glucosaminidase domain-containing protein n=1 Tax=Algoriphagus sp. SE2 TaxID=3141536 RepID=UPI0031CD7E96